MQTIPFNREDHIYRNDAFAEIVKDAVRFFNGTPALSLPPSERFAGAGVYALYYTGNFKPYAKYAELNRLAYNRPIYVGKAVPAGWRQSGHSSGGNPKATELYSRLRDHFKSIDSIKNLNATDFACRFVIMESIEADMIATIEAALIKINRPLWNTIIDGFGNHAPGSGRAAGKKSKWDILHPGRSWVGSIADNPIDPKDLLREIEAYLKGVGL